MRDVVTYPRDAILDREHVAAALGVDVDTVSKMDLPCFYPSQRPRYVWGQVLDFVAEMANPNAQPEASRRPRRKKTA